MLKMLRLILIFLLLIIEIINGSKPPRPAKYLKPPKPCQPNTYPIQIKIHTGDKLFAGTDSQIGLLLRSSTGVICQVHDLDNPGNDRERNTLDRYQMCCSKEFFEDKNELSMVALHQVTRSGRYLSFLSDDWFIERIEMHNEQKLIFDYRFHSWTTPSKKFIFGVSKINGKNYTRF